MLIVAFIIEVLIMLGGPLAFGIWLRKKWGLPWTLFLIGAVTFIASQVVHIPLNAGLTALFKQEWLLAGWLPSSSSSGQLLFNAVVLGLTAGLCEELARYFVLRLWLKEARSWRQAVVFGAGHGGLESALTGLLVIVTFAGMTAMRNRDLAAMGLPAEAAQQAAQQVAEFWAMPLFLPLLAAGERTMAIVWHLALSALVMQVFFRKRAWPLFAAIGWHSLANAIVVFVLGTWGSIAVEGAMAGLTLVSAAILWGTWRASQA
jgi:uncharacterized membrane protein YhfC